MVRNRPDWLIGRHTPLIFIAGHETRRFYVLNAAIFAGFRLLCELEVLRFHAVFIHAKPHDAFRYSQEACGLGHVTLRGFECVEYQLALKIVKRLCQC